MEKATEAVAVRDNYLEMIKNAVTDSSVDVGKMRELLEMQKEMMAIRADQEFSVAMNTAQKEIPKVNTNKRSDKGSYATYEGLDKAVRPIYVRHGFSLNFNTEETLVPDVVNVVCVVRHNGGHKERYMIPMPADGKGARGNDVMTKTHATGSAVTYGMRYLLKLIFNIVVGDEPDDDNGKRASSRGRGSADDHKFKDEDEDDMMPTSKAAQRATTSAPAGKKYGLKPAANEDSRIFASNVKTIEANMKRAKKSLKDFADDFGFPLNQLNKKDLNVVISWIQGKV